MASKRTKEILEKLDQVYTREHKCYLNYETPEQLLVATMLSAQCTDARVNVVTKDLFKKYPDMEAFAKADLEVLEQDIKPKKDLPGIRRESPPKPGGSGKPSRSGKKNRQCDPGEYFS